MSHREGYTRRWLLNASGSAMVASALGSPSIVLAAEAGAAPKISESATTLAKFIAGTLDRELPADVVAGTKLHILDTFAAMISGSRLGAGKFAASYIDTLGGKPQATVVGSKIVTSVVNAALANGMATQADETDDDNPIGPIHPGGGAIAAAYATGEVAKRTGAEMIRAVSAGYDVGVSVIQALGLNEFSKRYAPSNFATTFIAATAASAMLRLKEDQVRWVLSLAMQQASGTWIWKRDTEHVEKAFDFMGMGSRNGVMAATMVAAGLRGVDDAFAGNDNFFSALADEASPEKLVADLGKNTGVLGTAIKKYTVGGGCQSVLDSTSNLLANAAVRADNLKTINVQMPPNILKIFDNNPVSDLCVQHLVAMMIIDKGVTFKSVHDEARMQDPKILAVRKLVELTPNETLGKPPQQAIVTIATTDGQTFTDHTTYVRGSPKNPMDAKEVSAKARDLIVPILGAGRSDDLIKAILDLEHFGSLSGLRKLVQV